MRTAFPCAVVASYIDTDLDVWIDAQSRVATLLATKP
jgi:hypothetical protein